MSAHTAGPWYPGHFGREDMTCQCRTILSEVGVGGICTILVDNGLPISEGGNDAPPKAEAVANMHLIAAAPDLLTALKYAAELLEYGGFDMTKVEAAIAKAEGRA